MAKKSGHWYCPVCGEKHGYLFFERYIDDLSAWGTTLSERRRMADKKRANTPLYCRVCGAKLRRSKRTNNASWIPFVLLYMCAAMLSILFLFDRSFFESLSNGLFLFENSEVIFVCALICSVHVERIRPLIPYEAKEETAFDDRAKSAFWVIAAIVVWCIWIYTLGAPYGAFEGFGESVKTFFLSKIH